MTVGKERVADGPHPFWDATCGIDTHRFGSRNARNYTPWAAFTSDQTRLVCTVWSDLVATVVDPADGRERRFVSLGGHSRHWKSGAVKRGREAQQALERARALQLPVYGFEVAVSGADVEVSRSIKHVYMDRVHSLKLHFGLHVDELKTRLGIMPVLESRWKSADIDALYNGMLFELVDASGDIPGAAWTPRHNTAAADAADAKPGGAMYWAKLALPILVEHVRLQTDDELVPLTYEELAEKLGRVNKHGLAWARGIGHPLGEVTGLIESATQAWPAEDRPPYLTSVVVLKSGPDAGLPDIGVQHRWPDFSELSRAEKRARVGDEYRMILAYGSRWFDVLKSVNLQPLVDVEPTGGETRAPGAKSGWGGGESEDHRALKEYVLAQPELFGLELGCFAQPEYPLLSGDKLDVFFRTDNAWVGVEVKSHRSADDDLERGIYQIVKYRAVLEAQAKIHAAGVAPRISVVLVVQRDLPRPLQQAAAKLEVQWSVCQFCVGTNT